MKGRGQDETHGERQSTLLDGRKWLLRAILRLKLDYFRILLEVTKWVNSMKYALFSFALGFLTAGLAPRPALAATSNASFAVTATVQAGCQVSASSTAFGIYTTPGANSTSAVSVACTTPTPYNVGFSSGFVSGAEVVTWKMTGSASRLLGYALALSSKGKVNWGQSVGAPATVAGAGDDSAQTLSIQGQVPAGQQVASSGYGDTITVAITY